MADKFERLGKEKRDRIINAALSEFAKYGYDNASTNVMVKEAGISKGLIFHYFGTKENLFMYLVNYCSGVISKELNESVNLNEKDILILIQDYIIKKLIILQKYPSLFDFLLTAFNESNTKLKRLVLEKTHEIIEKGKIDLWNHVDPSYFKEGLDIEKTYVVIVNALEKISLEEFSKEAVDMDSFVDILNDYIDYFRKVFYR